MAQAALGGLPDAGAAALDDKAEVTRVVSLLPLPARSVEHLKDDDEAVEERDREAARLAALRLAATPLRLLAHLLLFVHHFFQALQRALDVVHALRVQASTFKLSPDLHT